MYIKRESGMGIKKSNLLDGVAFIERTSTCCTCAMIKVQQRYKSFVKLSLLCYFFQAMFNSRRCSVSTRIFFWKHNYQLKNIFVILYDFRFCNSFLYWDIRISDRLLAFPVEVWTIYFSCFVDFKNCHWKSARRETDFECWTNKWNS